MRCPMCRSQVWVMKIANTLFRVECVSLCCEYVDEFVYDPHDTQDLTNAPEAANVGVAG